MDASVQELLDLEGRLCEEAAGERPEGREFTTAVHASQLAIWPPELRASWRQDLLDAQGEGRNLVNEKYIYTLKRTAPEQYAAVKDTLPDSSLEKLWLADWISQAQAVWQEALAKKYPGLMQSRAIRRDADGRESVSFETAVWSELMTCSVNTLRLYAYQVERAQKAGRNLCEVVWKDAARQLGYKSLEAVEESILKKAE